MGKNISELTKAEQGELNFWSGFPSHLCEIDKQTFALQKMGIKLSKHSPQLKKEIKSYSYDLQDKSVLEIGAGPVGTTLRCVNGRRKIIEPLPYPNWVWDRYDCFGVEYERIKAEDMDEEGWDEVWVLNVLQHVDDLDLVLKNIKKSAKILRIFEWLEIPTDVLHKFSLSKLLLDEALGIDGQVELIDREYMYNSNVYCGSYDLSSDMPEQTSSESEVTPSGNELHQKWGGNLHRAMIHYIKATRDDVPLVGAEVGVLDGKNAEIILNTLNIERLFLIDPYTVYESDLYSQADLTNAKHSAMARLEKFKDKITWLPFSSLHAAKYLKAIGIKLDFAYLDGGHNYEEVTEDVIIYSPIVKEDGVIGGHDFIDDIVEANRQIQVKSAIMDYTAQNNIQFYSCDFEYSDWWIDKR